MQISTKTAQLLRLVASRASLLLFLVAILTPVFSYTRGDTPAPVYAATSSNLNYQARLLKANGSLVEDGYYNLEFKLYNTSSGGVALWSEAYYDSNGVTAGNDNRVRVVNGYISVNLGSQTAFPNINWDQDMWLTMNVGGSTQTATPTYDGEMNPRIKLTAVPYAFEAKQAQSLAQLQGAYSGTLGFDTLTASRSILLPDAAGTVCLQASASCGFVTGASSDFIQNSTSLQLASNFNIQARDSGLSGTVGGIIRGAAGGQTVDLLQLQNSAGTVLSAFTSNGSLRVGAASGSGLLTIGTDTTEASDGIYFGTDTNLYRSAVNTLKTDNNLFVQTATNSTAAFQVQNTSGTSIFNVDTVNARIGTANTAAASTNSQVLTIRSGDASGTTSNSGNVVIDSGTATGTAGNISIGTAAYAHNTTIGNTTGTSALTLQGGTGGINLTTSGASNTGVIVKGTANSTNAFSVQAANGNPLLHIDTSLGYVINNGIDSPGNLLVNPSFEAGNPGAGGGTTGWGADGSTYTVVSNNARTGNKAFSIAASVTNSSAKVILVEPGDSFYYQAYVKRSVGGTRTAGLAIWFADKDYNLLALPVTSCSPTTTYELCTGTATAPANAHYAWWGFNTNAGSGTIYFDDAYSARINRPEHVLYKNGANSTAAFQIQNASGSALLNVNTTDSAIINNGTTTPGNEMENPGFESGGGTVTSGWTYSTGSIGNTAANARSGNRYYTAGSGTDASATTTKYFHVMPGATYRASIWAKNASANAGSQTNMTLTFYDKDKLPITPIEADTFTGAQTAYTLLESTKVAPSNAVYATVSVGYTARTAGTWYFDDASFTRTSYEGEMLLKTTDNSTAAFQIQSSSSDVLFRADTTNNRVYVGNAAAATGADSTLLVVDSATTTNLPTGVNGGIIYDTTANKFKVYEDGQYKVLCNTTDLSCGVGANPTLQDAYNNSSSPATIATTSATKDIILKSGTGFDSGSMFQLQNAAAQTLFVADTVNQRVAVGPAAVPANGVLTVGANTTAASGGIYFGTDTNLYRSGVNRLKTDSPFDSANTINANIGTADAVYIGWNNATAASAISFNNDTNLYRAAANELKTDDAFTIAGLLTGQVGTSISGGVASINASSNFATNINTGTSTGTVAIGNNTGNTAITIDSGTGAINIGTGSQSRPVNIATGVAAQSLTLGSTNTTSSTLIQGGTGNITINANGASNTGTTVKTSTNSSLAFQIQSAGSDRLFSSDTVNNRVYVGNATAVTSADTTLLVVDSAPTTTLPIGVNGGIIYDSTANKFKIYENGAYKILCNTTDLGCGAGATTTLQDVYNNSASPAIIATTSATKDIIFRSGTGFNSASLFQIQNASSQTLFVADTVNQRVAVGPAAAPANGVLTVGTDTTAATGGIYFGTDTNLYRSAINELKTDDAFVVAAQFTGQAGAAISGGIVNLNASSNFATNINTGTSTGAVNIGNNTGNTAITVDSGTGTINIGTGGQARSVNIATGAAAQSLILGSTTTTSSTLIQGGTGNVTINASGATNTGTIVKTAANSTNAFQVQNSAGTPDVLFRADSVNNRVYVGNATATTGADSTLLVIDSASSTTLPTGVNGGIIYDSTDNKFKIYENGQYKVLCNTTDLGCGAAGASQSLQDAYNNSSTPATITTASATKDIIFKSGGTFNSTSIFQIQSSGSDVLFRADTVNNRVYVGNATAAAAGDSTLLVVDSSSTTNLPTGVNGGIIYDSTDNKFKIYENGAYKVLCNTTDLACGAAGVAQTLQDAYNNSSTPALITTSSATKDIIIRSGVGVNSAAVFQIQNASSQTLFVADTVNQRIAVGPAAAAGNSVLTVGTNTSVASGGIYFGTDTNLYRSAVGMLRTDGSVELGEGVDRTFNVQGRSTNVAGNNLTISAGNAGTGASAFSGGTLVLQGGNAAGTGNANGGNVLITGGTGTGTGTRGLVVIDTPTFSTNTNANCSTHCTLSQSHIDNSGAVIVNATTTDLNITVPDPTNAVAGRIVYITAASGSADFTLLVNGGGVGNEIAMRQNTSATMIWNGTDWTAAGASSSTTLQAAYNNTLTSAGGAEIFLNNTASSNGLTIRNNQTSPIMGSLFEVQSAIGNNLLSVNNNANEYVSNGGAEVPSGNSTVFPVNTWSPAPAGGTVSRNITLANVATGQASVQVSTTLANHGVLNKLTQALSANTTYQVSYTGKLSSGSFTTLDTYYSRDGGATLSPCASAQTLVTTGWSKVTCTFTTDGTAATDPIMIIRQSDAATRTFWIDNLSVTLSTTVSTPPNVQIGGGIYGGTPTLLTLDRSSSPPVANGNDVYFGSMYYDTTSGRIQCYEADGWGACGSAPDNFVNLVPEYAGAVLNGSGVGTMSADFCANSGALSVNPTLCASGQALNFYRWTSPQATQQLYSIYVTYQLPAAFKHFANDNTVTLTARTDNVTNAQVTYQMYRSEGGTLTACGTETTVTTSANTWQQVGINGNEYSGCGFSTSSANNNVIFKINVKANSNANAYVGTLSFTSIGQ